MSAITKKQAIKKLTCAVNKLKPKVELHSIESIRSHRFTIDGCITGWEMLAFASNTKRNVIIIHANIYADNYDLTLCKPFKCVDVYQDS